MPSIETEHAFMHAIQNSPIIPIDAPPLPAVFSHVLALAGSPEDKARTRAVFFSGRMYETSRIGQYGETIYENPDPWREQAKGYAAEAGAVYLDGVGEDPHSSPMATAGKALLNIMLAPALVVNAIGRVGAATHHEAAKALEGGSNVGVIVPPTEYESTVAYLEGRHATYPTSLPAWWGALDVPPTDIIAGFEALPEWISKQLQEVTPKAFRARTIALSSLTHILYYGHMRFANDAQELTSIDAVLHNARITPQ